MPFMIINHGAPGTGKSTFAKEIASGINATICSTDDFFIVNGAYEFNPKLLNNNHILNYRKARNCCESGKNLIIDNTNCVKRNYKIYEELAEEYNYTVYNIYFKPNPGLSIKRNSHKVPVDTINRFSYYLVCDFIDNMKEIKNMICKEEYKKNKLTEFKNKIYYKYIRRFIQKIKGNLK